MFKHVLAVTTVVAVVVAWCSSDSPTGLSDLAKSVGADQEYSWEYEFDTDHELYDENDYIIANTRQYLKIEGVWYARELSYATEEMYPVTNSRVTVRAHPVVVG